MDAIKDKILLLKSLKKILPDLLVEVLNENATLIEDLNIAQLQKGERADGEILPDYSRGSIARGKRPGPMTLFDTGKFYRAIKIETIGKALAVTNDDSKANMLVGRYGEEILGFQEQNLEIIKYDIALPGLQEKIQSLL